MTSNEQDGKLSAPQWWLDYLLEKYGSDLIKRLHLIGSEHDRDIELKGWSEANKNIKTKLNLKNNKIPAEVRYPIIILVRFYRFLPKFLKNLYFKLIV